MAKKRTIFKDGIDPTEALDGVPKEDPVVDEGRKISELPPAPLDPDGVLTPELEAGEMPIAASVPPAGNVTYKIKLSDVIANAKSEFDEYNVKNLIAGTHIDDITETPVDSGNWTINAEKQRMDPGTFVESLNGVRGDVVLTSTDESILIAPEEVIDPDTNVSEFTGNIDLTLNTTTSTMFRAWIEVTAANQTSGVFNFNNDLITKENSIVTINGVVLEGTQYDLVTGTVTILNLTSTPLAVGDEIGVVSYTAEVPNSTLGNPTYGLQTKDISTVGARPVGVEVPEREEIKNQQEVNWYLLDKIDNLEIPEDQDLSTYETIVKSEADDADLQSQIDALSASGGYNDAWIQPSIDAGDDTTLADAKAYTDGEVAAITHPDPPDLAPYETIVKSEADDASTLAAAKSYTDSEVAAITHPDPPDLAPYETIVKSEADDASTLVAAKGYTDQKFNAVVHPSPTIVSATEPSTKTDGTNWFDTVRLELFVRASSSWLPSSPLGARVTQGEIVQAQIIDEVGRKVGVSGPNEVDTTFRIKSSSKTFVSTSGNELGLYNLRSPTDDSHAVNLGYANEHYQRSQKPIGFKIDQSAVCSLSTTPRSGEFCGLHNSSPGSSTSANNYFGNFNAGIRVHIDKLKNPLGETFAPNERYNIAGTVTIFGKTSGKLFFRHGVTMVSRDTSHDYVTLTFTTRVPTFGTGAITAEDESKYIVIVDGLTAATTSTTLIPEGESTDE